MAIRRAKIVCTLGPASNTPETIEALVAAGMDTARLNFSHGTHQSHAQVCAMVRAAAVRAGRPVAILADMCGPKMRVGKFANGSIQLKTNDTFTLTTEPITGDEARASVTYAELPHDVKPGDPVLLDDGLIRLRVVKIDGIEVLCEVEIGGTLSDNKGLNLPGAKLSTPALTEKDKIDLAFAVNELHVDYLGLSFVRTPTDVLKAQQLAKGTKVIAKVENWEAIEHLQIIADVADGVMVARGDLGVELGSEKVPLIQKRIIHEVNERGKVVITATQMLESMVRNPRPTRAEAADVANAVIDGTDAVMLSAETASGSYPVEAVQMMAAIVQEVEQGWLQDRASRIKEPMLVGDWGFANSAARAAAILSYALSLKAIVTFTRDGRTAELLSSYRPRAPIVAITPKHNVATRLAIQWGITPRVAVPPTNLTHSLEIAIDVLNRENMCKPGETFALVVGWPPSSGTNTVKLHRMGESVGDG